MRDYYKVLGVQKSISQVNLKKHFYKLAKQYHPDTVTDLQNGEKILTEKKFKEITEAYNAISSPVKRRRYDNGGMNMNSGYSTTYSSRPSVPKKDLILAKLRKKEIFSTISFAAELKVNPLNLEKILMIFFKKFNIDASIKNRNVIYGI